MNDRIRLDPDDLRLAADTYRDAHASLTDVRERLRAIPPAMPADLTAHTGQVLLVSAGDVTDQLVYLSETPTGSIAES